MGGVDREGPSANDSDRPTGAEIQRFNPSPNEIPLPASAKRSARVGRVVSPDDTSEGTSAIASSRDQGLDPRPHRCEEEDFCEKVGVVILGTSGHFHCGHHRDAPAFSDGNTGWLLLGKDRQPARGSRLLATKAGKTTPKPSANWRRRAGEELLESQSERRDAIKGTSRFCSRRCYSTSNFTNMINSGECSKLVRKTTLPKFDGFVPAKETGADPGGTINSTGKIRWLPRALGSPIFT